MRRVRFLLFLSLSLSLWPFTPVLDFPFHCLDCKSESEVEHPFSQSGYMCRMNDAQSRTDQRVWGKFLFESLPFILLTSKLFPTAKCVGMQKGKNYKKYLFFQFLTLFFFPVCAQGSDGQDRKGIVEATCDGERSRKHISRQCHTCTEADRGLGCASSSWY